MPVRDTQVTATIDGRRFSSAEIDAAELGRARHALAYLTRLIGNDGMRDLLRRDTEATASQVLDWVAVSGGVWRSGTVELVVSGLDADAFLAWYRRNTDPGHGDALARETRLRAGHPEHFINHPRPDGIEVIETIGETDLPWHVLYRSLPEDGSFPAPWDPAFPVRFGAEVIMGGVRVGYSMRQLRDDTDGMHMRCTTYLPQAAPAELARRHLTHISIEFCNWALAARREQQCCGIEARETTGGSARHRGSEG